MPELLDRLQSALTDRYRLERELGAGGMATVYLAHDLRHGRRVALKLLKPELAAVIGAERPDVHHVGSADRLPFPDAHQQHPRPVADGDVAVQRLSR